MKQNLSFAEIVGIPQTDSWSQVFVKHFDKPEKGELFYLLSLKNVSDEDTTVLGKMLETNFSEAYETSNQNPYHALQDALVKVKEIIIARGGLELELAAGLIVKDVLYIVRFNQAKIYLYRQQELVGLASGEGDTKNASGYLKNDDLVIISSSDFHKLVGQDELLKSLDHRTPEDISSILAPVVLGTDPNSRCAFLIIKMQFIQDLPDSSEENPEDVMIKIENTEPESEIHEEALSSLSVGSALPVIDFSAILKPLQKLLPKGKVQKTAISLAVIILFLLMTSIIWGAYKKDEDRRRQEFEVVFLDAKNKVEEGMAIIDLNNIQARNYLQSAKNLMDEQMKKNPNKKSEIYQKAAALEKEANDGLVTVSGVFRITNPEVFFDLTLVKDKAVGTMMSLYNDNLSILDKQNNSVYLLDVNAKSSQVVASGNGLVGVKLLTQGTNTYLFAPDSGIYTPDKNTGKLTKIIDKDDNWKDPIDMATFSGNIYLLDKSSGEIIKYMPVENGFSDRRSYLAKDVKPDFSKSVDLNIDGYVWVLNSDGNIVKFGQGHGVNFIINGLDENFSNPIKLYSSDETENIYILDKGNKRVVVLNKDGTYQSQYQWNGLDKVVDIVALEKDKKMLLLSGSKIFSITLK